MPPTRQGSSGTAAPALSEGATSSTSPPTPRTIPASVAAVGRAPRVASRPTASTSQSPSTMKSGPMEMSSVAMPEGMLCSAHETRPLPNSRSKAPTTALSNHCRGVGRIFLVSHSQP